MVYSDTEEVRLVAEARFEIKSVFLNALSFPQQSCSQGFEARCHFVDATCI